MAQLGSIAGSVERGLEARRGGPRRARADSRPRCPREIRNAQSEDCSASSSRSARSDGRARPPNARSSAARWTQARPPADGRAPGAQVAPVAPARRPAARRARPRTRPPRAAPSSTPRRSHASITARSQSTPSGQKWPSSSVSSATTDGPPRAATRSHEVLGVGGDPGRPRGRGRRRRRRSPTRGGGARSAGACRGTAPATGSRRGARRARSPRGRSAPARRPPRCGAAPAARARARRSSRRTPRARRPPRACRRATGRARTRAARGRRPTRRSARGATAIPVRSCSRTPVPVASSGRTACVAAEVQLACGAKAAQQVAAPLERVGGRGVGGGAALQRRGHRRVGRLDVEPVRGGPDLAQEGEAALERARRLELVAQHRRQRQRDAPGMVVEHVEQRQVAGGDRLPQPLLAERPRPEALDVGHVRVEDDREPAHGRSTARKSSARSSPDAPQREVARRDRRREAVVERLGDAQPRVDGVPAGVLERQLVGAQLARVEEAEQVDGAEVALAQRAVLARRGTRARATGCRSARRPSAPA